MTGWKSERRRLLAVLAVFLAFFWLPAGRERFAGAIMESLHLARWYAREHFILCLVPAFFIAGAIGVFISRGAVMKYLGAGAAKAVAYGTAAVCGSVLAVCSCTILPMFAGIRRRGAGLGPACAFLYSGPAINIMAVIVTARILGPELGIARAVGAVLFSIVIGLAMHALYRREETGREEPPLPEPAAAEEGLSPARNALLFSVMIGILVFANWGAPRQWHLRMTDGTGFNALVISAPEEAPGAGGSYRLKPLDAPGEAGPLTVEAADIAAMSPLPGAWASIWRRRWLFTAALGLALALILADWFKAGRRQVLAAVLVPAALALSLPADGLWMLVPFSAAIAGLSLILARGGDAGREWLEATWSFAGRILPLLLIGVLAAGFLLGRPGREGFLPSHFIRMLVGADPGTLLAATGLESGFSAAFIRAAWPFWTNFFASVFGAFMYFATLTEVPILQGLLGAGMGRGPALALLLAGPALSLPNMLVIRGVMGTKKTAVFVSLVVFMATISGLAFDAFF